MASLELEKGTLKDADIIKWINLLLAPGASLGGARPKASVTDTKGELWIAKFPSVSDKTDIGGWELVANQLAQRAGIRISEAKAQKSNSPHHSFLSKRFDRNRGRRFHFASAMTLLGKSDGAEGVSYLDIGEFITQQGSNSLEDLHELWRRIVFNIAIKNTDDHLRNHGFLLTAKGWRLSPVYDFNPTYHGRGLTLNISETDNSLDVDLALSVAKYFRLEHTQASQIISGVKKAVSVWRRLATVGKINRQEQELMETAFEHAG
jgi:serine/threonine-protein kinase HipA